MAEIETLFKSYATQPLEAHPGLAKWMTSTTAPDVFKLPARPTGLTLTEGAGGNALAWTASTDAKVDGYNVYRSSSVAGSSFEQSTKTSSRAEATDPRISGT